MQTPVDYSVDENDVTLTHVPELDSGMFIALAYVICFSDWEKTWWVNAIGSPFIFIVDFALLLFHEMC